MKTRALTYPMDTLISINTGLGTACRVPEMRGIVLRSVLPVREQGDNEADSVPREQLPRALMLLLLCLIGFTLLNGCALSNLGPQPVTTNSLAKDAGPYWHGSVDRVQTKDVLDYYQRIKDLSGKELNQEYKRVSKTRIKSKHPLNSLQFILFSLLPDPPVVSSNLEKANQILAELRTQTDSRGLPPQNLLILLEDVVSLKLAGVLHNKKCSDESHLTDQKIKALEDQVTTYRQEAKTLSEQIQKLKDIERILIDRDPNNGTD